eukprot:189287_1
MNTPYSSGASTLPCTTPFIVWNIWDTIQSDLISNVFFVFNKSKILILNNSDKLVMMSQIHKAEQMKGYSLILFQYYNADKKCIENTQYLWLDFTTKYSRITKYILNNLHEIYTHLYPYLSHKWSNNLLNTLI